MDNILERMMTNRTDSAVPDRLGNALTAGQDRAPGAMDQICRRIMGLNERANNHEARLQDLRDRLMVAEPRNEKGPKQPEEVCGQVVQIERELTRLEETLECTTGVIARLEDL